MSDEGATRLFTEIATRFHTTHLRLAMLRGDGSAPVPGAGDVDLLVHPDDTASAVRLLHEAARVAGWRRLFEEQVANHTHVVLWRDEAAVGPLPSVHFDLQDALGRRGLRYARAEPFLAATTPGPWLPRLQPVPRVLALALHTLLDKAGVREEYRPLLEAAGCDGLERFANEVLPRRAATSVVAWIREGAPRNTLVEVASRVRRDLERADPAGVVRGLALRLRRRMRLFGPRRGVLVAFLGPDGAGKSSLVEAVAAAIPRGPYPVRAVYLGKREAFLPTSRLIRRLYASRPESPSPATETRSRSVAGRLRDIAGLANWYAEQWARYWCHARPALQQGGVVLADRYAFDVANREAGSLAHTEWFRKLLPRTFPLPDRTYLLWEQPEVLHRRKPELGEDEARLLLARLRAIVVAVPGSRELRTDRPLDETANAITRDVTALLERRCR